MCRLTHMMQCAAAGRMAAIIAEKAVRACYGGATPGQMTDPIGRVGVSWSQRKKGDRTMKLCGSLLLKGIVVSALALTACTQTGPVEFSATGADAPDSSRADDMDFGPMDHSIAECKAAAQRAGTGRCVKVRAYEACMKTRGYITVLGPENPAGCGQPAWEQDVRKWLQ
ncbi:hypothetical protein [Paraburkholderia sp.]|jgi:hypothetical protein|uniref:hypothetical protein n=1 Tax=Paraburkholderia sp. TaxID=1926495 RepID=UPI002F4075AB